MTKRQPKPNEDALTVGGSIQRMIRSPFMTASEVVVKIPTDVNDRHVYVMSGTKTPGGTQLFGLSRAALDTIKDACGVLILESYLAPGVPVEPDCVTWQVKGQRDQVDGFRQKEVATYMLDLRVPRNFDPDFDEQIGGGGRYSELYDGYLSKQYDTAGKKLGMNWASGAAGTKRDLTTEEKMEEKEPGWTAEQRKIAHIRAVKEVRRRRPHITRLAETGAIHALIRNMLGVKHAYTKAELDVGITVIRAQANTDALDQLPEDVRIKLLTAQAMQAYGVDASYASMLLGPGEEEAVEPEAPEMTEPPEEFYEGKLEDLDEEELDDEDVIEGEVVDEKAEEPTEEKAPAPKTDGLSEDFTNILEEIEGQDGDHKPKGIVQATVRREMVERNIAIVSRDFPMDVDKIREAFSIEQGVQEEREAKEPTEVEPAPEEIQI